MNHYANLAAMIVRLVAVGLFLLAVGSLFVFFGLGAWRMGMMGGAQDGMMDMNWGVGIAGFVVYAVLAVVLYLLSKPIGRLIGGGLEREPDRF